MGSILGDDGGDNQIGVAPGAKWIAAKGCEDYSCSYDALLSSGQWVLAPTDLNGQNPRPDLRPQIVSNSWGGWGGDTFFQTVVQNWVAAGIFPVFAIGNDGSYCGSSGSPGDYPESYGVGAYDSSLNIAYFSGRGPSAFGITKPNIAAPGVNVRSSVPEGYDSYSGTSMATPHVAGTVALMWSAALSLDGDVATTRALLDEAAVDVSDTSCGGTDQNNDVWGEGMLDAYRAVELSPRGPTGEIVGTVTDNGGNPLVGAQLAINGPLTRTTQAAADGSYHFRAPVGSHSITASAFAYYTQKVDNLQVVQDTTTTQNFALQAAPSHAVKGTVVDEEGSPVGGATITIQGTPIVPAVTDATGAFSFASVPEGDYQMLVTAGSCLDAKTIALKVDSNETVPVAMTSRTDAYGYTCRLVPMDYIATDTPVSMYGESSTTSVTLPFKFMLYGTRGDKAVVSPAGYLSFSGLSPYWDNLPIPDPTEPNSALYGFWDDNYMDSESSAGTTVVGTAPNRQFVMEWRNVAVAFDFGRRITFEMVLNESNGEAKFQYLSVDPSPSGMGNAATVGIENKSGTTAFQYSYNQAVISSGLAIRYFIPHSGVLQGTITDTNDGLAVSGAQVTALDSSGNARVTTTDETGFYAFQAKTGTCALTVTKKNYGDATGSGKIEEGSTKSKDFAHKTPRAVATPTTLQVIMPTDSTRSRAVVLSNTGTLPLTFDLKESGGKKQTTVSTSGLVPLPSHDPKAATTKGLYDSTTPPTGWAALDTGDTLFSFTPAGMSLAWGVGYAGSVWLSDFCAMSNREFTTVGAPTGRMWSAPWGGYALGDMAFDSARNRMCELAIGNDNGIHCWDPDTGVVTGTIAGSFQWTQTDQRGLAYRVDDDSFYVGGWWDGTIYHVQGFSDTSPGSIISSCRPPDSNISGLAFNDAMGVLWEATNSTTDTIYQLNPDDCSVLSALKHPQAGGYQGAGLEMDVDGNLWMIGQSPNTVYLVDSGVPAYADVPWMSVTPTSGTLAKGAKQSLAVTISSKGLDAGVYSASLFIATNAGRTQRIRIPVSLVVSAYQQAVNAGGSAYTDGNGDPWAKDQAYSGGKWGYVQKGSINTSKKTIKGTNDQALFQSQHEDPYGYRYDNVPNGIYQIDMDFAELSGIKLGKRLFDAIVEDTTVLAAHDIVYEVGDLTAESRTLFVPVVDNRMDVRFIARKGYKLPVINALRVTHRPDK